MKVFDLVCSDGHRFEGWFASADQFVDQSRRGLVRCPICDAGDVHREPSAPRLRLGTADSIVAPTGVATGSEAPADDPSRVVAAAMARLRQLIAGTDDVGDRFAEEARRIHYDEIPPRPIRGVATEEERRALDDEGIETLAIPVPPALTGTLQ